MAAVAEEGGRPPEEAPGERSGRTLERPGRAGSNTDSDETVVEGSVTESDVEEEEEFCRRRLAYLNKDIALTTEISVNKGAFSPEISFIQKFGDHTYYHKTEQINPVLQEASTSDQSQSLLKGWISHSSSTDNISKPGFSLNSAAEEQQNNSVDIKLNGFQKDAEEKPVGGQQREKEVISDFLDATFSEKQTSEGHSCTVEPAACAEPAQTISSKNQKSTSEDKRDLETIIWQEIILSEFAEANQRRRSKRIDNKQRREAFGRNSVNPTRALSLSTIHRRNVYGENLLHRAVIHQDINLVRRIIQAGGSVNAQDYAGLTALHIASVEGSYSIANLLLKAGADVNATQNEQITPLQDAVKEGHYEVANLLLWYGADPLLKDQMGRCALEEASDPSMMKLLKSYVAKSRRCSVAGGSVSKNTLNTQCVEDTNQHQTEESEPACANPQATSQKAKAAPYSSSSKNKLSSNQSQLSQASEQQTSKKSESTREETVIVHGTCKTRPERKMKIRRNAKGETQLHIAAKRGNLSLVKTLISSGICVNEQDYAGWTAIHEASNRGFTDVILELLKAGADVNSRSLCGVLPIHDAVSGNYLEAVKILLQHGANPNERNGSGESAFNQAWDEEMKELLKSYGAVDSVLPIQTVEVTEGKSKRRCRDCYKYDDAALETEQENYNVKSLAPVQDTVKKQEELLLFELRTSKDADVYIQRLSHIQDTLDEILAKQKTERDMLAEKCRTSVESFKRGALRKQLINLASRQKSLLTVAQNQEILVQKIQNCRKTKQMFNSSAEKQISNLVIFHGSDTRQSLTPNEIMCPNTVALNMGLGSSAPNGNRVEAHVSLENRFSTQEFIQHPHSCLDETEASKEAITSKKASDHALASENREFSHKATLLKNGKIRTSKGQILQNPVQWVKDLLGSGISVTWKYVWNKVTYLGTELSKFSVSEVSVSSDLELPTQKGNPSGSSVQFNSVESLTHFLQFHEIVMAHKEEFLPCSAMEKHWSFYKECKDFGF
ncbi:ankyrin repeat domain-containing protein 31 isoform X3 [Parus major]|uniref:ankyrin repeat domain-containing protein 31 isoform X3 n=1 Tax=Parus major TaxID=9157 RepID=UPI0014441D72|nr:ankyrin repeat domain-containing protein 31 isoform X3 [Parus major]